MALPVNHPVSEMVVSCHSPSIGTVPIVGYLRAPFRAKVVKVGAVQSAAVTGTSTITTAINGTTITGGAIAVTGGSAGSGFSASPTGANSVVEDDVVSFTPAGATGGASVTGHLYAVFRRA